MSKRARKKSTKKSAYTPASIPDAPQTLERFEVFGLFGRQDLALKLKDSRLILVGENGTGKSTIINILYYTLTKQWARLADLPFSKIRAVFSTTTIEIEREKIKINLGSRPDNADIFRYLVRHYGVSIAEQYMSGVEEFSPVTHPELAIEIRRLREYLHRQPQGAYLTSCDSAISRLVRQQILFLPTYRRIERDLQAIFPQMRAERDLKVFHRSTPADSTYVELVEFGMRDVADVIKCTMQALDRDFRQDLVKLTSVYLRDVIRGEYKRGTFETLLSDAATQALPALLARIDDKILPSEDRQTLNNLIPEIQKMGAVPDESQVAAHFLVRLVEMQTVQSQREAPVRAFAEVCNGYLSEKLVMFDASQFELFICRTDDFGKPIPSQKIPVEGLSSGEKQIVSVFAHMYLSGRSEYYVLIDEPELSISVVWQRKFLEDIIKTKKCAGLVAVTHSPFIFDNELSPFTHAVSEFILPRNLQCLFLTQCGRPPKKDWRHLTRFCSNISPSQIVFLSFLKGVAIHVFIEDLCKIICPLIIHFRS